MNSPPRNIRFCYLAHAHDLIEKKLQKKKQQLGKANFVVLRCFLTVFDAMLVSLFQASRMTSVRASSLLFRPASFFRNLF